MYINDRNTGNPCTEQLRVSQGSSCQPANPTHTLRNMKEERGDIERTYVT